MVAPLAGGGSVPPYIARLNPTQREAVEATEGPVLVLAGAGTGKTRVLTTRLAHILLQGRAGPGRVMAVTFTNKAAREMQERVAHLLGRPVEGWWVGTFHALGARMLRAHAEAVGLKPNFTILDQDDQVRLVKQFLAAHHVDDKRWPARTVANQIQRWKDRGLMPDGVTNAEGSDIAEGKITEIYREYQDQLQRVNAADFGDLLLLNLVMFQNHPDILKKYQDQFRYVLVDEYQDTNVAQYLWLRLLASGEKNICCVGDDDQSIYSWRGAEVGNILRFEEDFPGAKVVRLERNYRSTPHILGAASGLIANNEGRLGKTLWTEDGDEGAGTPVRVSGHWDGEAEARFVVSEMEARHAKGERLDSMAVLVRAGFQMREFEERLITLGIPYRVIGGPRFYERQEIRDAIAYLRVIAQPADDLAFERIVNVPARKIGKTTMQTLHQYARTQRLPLTVAVRRLLETDELTPQARRALATLMDDFDRWRAMAAGTDHGELARVVLDESGYTEMWRRDKKPDAPGRLENLKEMIAAMEEFENLQGFLEHVSLVMDNEDLSVDDKTALMTLHGAKGLEFDTVFLPGWEEGLFPHQLALDESGTRGLEEERRLAYVG
ncbi:MAG: UvrD-helicase domain-containing protein, partial [Paracoccaceae bacterium]|nr:UvrD-helicase domain-containing protein [Paracoccaceae bacterium]